MLIDIPVEGVRGLCLSLRAVIDNMRRCSATLRDIASISAESIEDTGRPLANDAAPSARAWREGLGRLLLGAGRRCDRHATSGEYRDAS
jgi:hypothetical protein